jgi:hypothetical protein
MTNVSGTISLPISSCLWGWRWPLKHRSFLINRHGWWSEGISSPYHHLCMPFSRTVETNACMLAGHCLMSWWCMPVRTPTTSSTFMTWSRMHCWMQPMDKTTSYNLSSSKAPRYARRLVLVCMSSLQANAGVVSWCFVFNKLLHFVVSFPIWFHSYSNFLNLLVNSFIWMLIKNCEKLQKIFG